MAPCLRCIELRWHCRCRLARGHAASCCLSALPCCQACSLRAPLRSSWSPSRPCSRHKGTGPHTYVQAHTESVGGKTKRRTNQAVPNKQIWLACGLTVRVKSLAASQAFLTQEMEASFPATCAR